MDPLLRWVLAGVMLLGCPFVAIGGCEAIQTSRELERSTRTRGVVVDNRLTVEQRDGNEERAYQPVVEFRDDAGQVRRFTDPSASLPPDYTRGETVDLAFDPGAPEHARILSWKRLWLVPTLLIGVGALPSLLFAAILQRLGRAP